MNTKTETLAILQQILNDAIILAGYDLTHPAVLAASQEYDKATNLVIFSRVPYEIATI